MDPFLKQLAQAKPPLLQNGVHRAQTQSKLLLVESNASPGRSVV
jgi:hypothetical protein